MADVLPSSVAKVRRALVNRGAAGMWVPIYCANCGADGGLVPEAACDFAFYLCQPCADAYGEVAGTMSVPDDVFWQRVKDAQLEECGRELSGDEVADQLRDPESFLSKLARDRNSTR